jgi:hypothetical protein
MELLKSVFKQTSELVGSSASLADVWFKDFGQLELEKYLALKTNTSAKKTWFFRVDFRSGQKTARYLFFFGSPSHRVHSRCDVTLHVAREDPPGSFNYERLEYLSAPNVPGLVELGYDSAGEEFVSRSKNGSIKVAKIDVTCRDFFEDVIQRHFSS